MSCGEIVRQRYGVWVVEGVVGHLLRATEDCHIEDGGHEEGLLHEVAVLCCERRGEEVEASLAVCGGGEVAVAIGESDERFVYGAFGR